MVIFQSGLNSGVSDDVDGSPQFLLWNSDFGQSGRTFHISVLPPKILEFKIGYPQISRNFYGYIISVM